MTPIYGVFRDFGLGECWFLQSTTNKSDALDIAESYRKKGFVIFIRVNGVRING